MSEQSDSKSQEPEIPSKSPDSETPSINENKDNQTSTNSEEFTFSLREFLKNSRGYEAANNLEEICQGLGAANVFIDARSGGAYFAGDAKVDGDVVGHSQSKRTASATSIRAKEIAGRVLSADIKKVRSVYVQTSNYSDAQKILYDKHILILRGDSHRGKKTTGIHLLLSLSKIEKIWEIDPTLGEEDLKCFQVDTKQAYLIDTLTPNSAGKLNSFILNNLGQKLKEQSSYLIITVDINTQLSQEDKLGQYVIQWMELPPNKEILLKNHLAWYLENQKPDTIHPLTQQESVKAILNNRMLLPVEVDRLAKLLAKVVRNELSFEQALACFSGQVKQQVETWFDQKQDLSQRAFIIALAVLSGSKYQAVINASQSLQHLIEPPSEEETSNPTPTFKKKRSERLNEVSAHLTQGFENTEFGRSPVELVELDNPAFQPAILACIWNEYDFYRDKLLEWLYKLGFHPESEFKVRIKAAAAVGELSKYAFKDVLDRIIRPWANCSKQSVQKLVPLALSVPIFEGDLASQVLKLLHNWSRLKNNPHLRRTAIIAYGSYIGIRFPDIALRDLFKIAQSGDPNLLSATAESVTILFEAGKLVPNNYFLVLKTLQDWTSQPKDPFPHQLGLLIFWILMREARVPGASNQGYWPTLLRLAAQQDSVYIDIIIQLLRRSLNQKQLNEIEAFPLRKRTLEELHNWLQLVDDDTRLYPILGSILFKLVVQGDELEKLRILKKLKEWKSAGHPKAASKILSKIS